MKLIAAILTCLITVSCSFAQNEIEDQNIDGFIIVADTSRDYFYLRTKMFDLSEDLKVEIDTMGRGFNKDKQEIRLPEWDTGLYFPRRNEGKTLSLEQFRAYQRNTSGKTMVLVAGLFHNEEKAYDHLKFVKTKIPTAYILKTSLYMGCLH